MNAKLLSFVAALLLGRIHAFRPHQNTNSAHHVSESTFENKNKNTNKNTPRQTTNLYATKKFKNFEEVLTTFHEEPIVIYFSTATCGPCRLMKKEVAAIKTMVGDDMKLFSIDTEKWPSVGSRFKIARLPTIVLFCEGEVKLRLEGVNTADSVVEQMRSLL